MDRCGDETAASRRQGFFPSTHWTDVFLARSGDESRQRAALEHLLARYWKPVYCYLRCKGYDTEAAKDLTQGFFSEVVLGRHLIQRADRSIGTLRSFLLKSLNRYAGKVRRAATARKRIPEDRLVSLEKTGELPVPESLQHTTPSEAFDYAWASALLDEIIADVARECGETGKSVHWDLFRERVLLPIMNGADAPSLSSLCERHSIPTPDKASNMVITVKRRFQAVLKRHVRQLVESDADVHGEITYLMRIFSASGAGS
jgi:DNA-directed RNA polymerase specialized sigma24 family protein